MKLSVPFMHNLNAFSGTQNSVLWSGCVIAAAAITAGASTPVTALPESSTVQVAQTQTALPPIPYASTGGSLPGGEQYVVFINGNSDLLLQQVRQIEPGALINNVDGSSVIQAGRFVSLQNAQQRVSELSAIGVGAQVESTSFVSAPVAVTPVATPVPSVPTNATATIAGDLPPLPVSATASTVEFGQAAPFQTVPSPPVSAAPLNTAPPTANAVPIAQQQPSTSGYYIVVPGNAAELPDLANQVVSLGAPPSLVQMRNAPRGPHVAVGPYDDYGIAEEWNNYLRDAGMMNARVHFE